MISFIRSFFFAVFFYPGTLFFVLSSLAASWVGKRALHFVVKGWALYHRWCASLFLGIRTRIEGPSPREPVLVAAKHQSMFETIEMILLLNTPAVVMKSELTDIPLWGRVALLYGVIPVDREGGAAALRRMMRAARAAIDEGRPIVIFPEGTRVPPGEQPPLQPGFAGLYRALGLPVVPVALNSGRIWPRRAFRKQAGIVTVRFAPPVPPGLPRREIEDRVHAAINAMEREESPESPSGG